MFFNLNIFFVGSFALAYYFLISSILVWNIKCYISFNISIKLV